MSMRELHAVEFYDFSSKNTQKGSWKCEAAGVSKVGKACTLITCM